MNALLGSILSHCGPKPPSPLSSRPEKSWAFSSPKLMKSGFWKRDLPPCHPDRSAAQWRDLRFDGSFLEMFFDRAKRSGEICGSAVLSWECLSTGGIIGPPTQSLEVAVCFSTGQPRISPLRFALSKNISKKEPSNRRSLHCAALRSG